MSAPAISVAVRCPDGTQFHVVRGHAAIEHNVPADADTRFNVGSVAKQITAYLALQTTQQHGIDLATPVRTLVPRLEIDDVTVSEIITHTSGIRDTEAMLSLCGYRELDHYTATDLLNLAYRQRQRCTPPGQFLYSNTNYLLLAAILESVHSAPFAEIADSHIFKPLGMVDTAFRTDPRTPVRHAASSYEASGASFISGLRPVAIAGPGSLWTTPADLLLWLAHLGSPATGYWPTQLPFTSDIAYAQCGRGHTYGPGLFAVYDGGQPAVFHNGHEHGYTASTYLRGDGLAIACATNADWIPADKIMAELIRTRCTPDGVEAAVGGHIARPSPGRAPKAATSDEQPLEDLGRYYAQDVPGSIRLGRSLDGLSVTRRGTVDCLRSDPELPQRFRGHGMSITLTAPGTLPPDGFILDLDRAPGIQYARDNR